MTGAGDPIRRFLAARVEEGRMPGAAWWVGYAGEGRAPSSSGSVGYAAREPRDEPLGDATPFDLASLTKPLVTAMLAVMLEQDGRIDLASPLGDLLEEIASSPFGDCPLLDLARHESGLAAWSPVYVRARAREEFVRIIASIPPAAERGKCLYSDLGYILLGIALERVAGAGLDRMFDERIARPLGLARTAFATGETDFADAAATERGNGYERTLAGDAGRSHTFRDRLLRGEVHDGNAHALGGVAGHAGLFGPAAEIGRVALEVAAPDRLALGPAALDRLLGPSRGGRTVGWDVAERDAATRGILPAGTPGHTGFTGTSVALVPERRAVLVLLTNRVHPSVPVTGFQAIRRGFHRLALRALDRAPARGSGRS